MTDHCNTNSAKNVNDEVWVVDDDKSIRWVLEKSLQRESSPVKTFNSADDALAALKNEQPAIIFSDIRMPGTDGLVFLETLQTDYPDIPTIIMTAHSDLDTTVNAFKAGAFEYLPKPFDINDAVDVAKRAIEQREQRVEKKPESNNNAIESQDFIGKSAAIQKVFHAIGKLSKSSIAVLVTGESGTGKELIAKALHIHSPRANKPFIVINTAAIPSELLESELFGHEKGAFTGAHAKRMGRFEQADGGTLFLDEIGDMPAELQTRLLRVLADGEFYRVGGHTPLKVDVRVVAATHQDLQQRVKERLFREDLFHRLNVINIHSPALCERPDDIPLLLT
ncbi:MAG: sigma 54-interacting transcriptional regulator, partial [Thiotrichaceae bacterium]